VIPRLGRSIRNADAALLPLFLVASAVAFLPGCQSAPEPSVRERRESFRMQQRAFKGDSVHSILQTYLVIAGGPNLAQPSLDAKTGSLYLPPAPEGTYTQGLSVGIDPDGYLLTAGHVLRERNFVVGWIDGRLEIRLARVLMRSGSRDTGGDLAVISVGGKLDYFAHVGSAPARDDRVFAVVCNRGHSAIGGELDLAGGILLEGGRDSEGHVNPVIRTDVPLWHGDSGGPLLSAAGELIGINSAIEFTWFGRREILGGFNRISYFPDDGLVEGVIAADKAKAVANGGAAR
jgi:S1-C subfamily serine protease